MTSAISPNTAVTAPPAMASSGPTVELTASPDARGDAARNSSALPGSAVVGGTGGNSGGGGGGVAGLDAASNPARRSRVLSPTETNSKRLSTLSTRSTTSNPSPSREAPATPIQQSVALSPLTLEPAASSLPFAPKQTPSSSSQPSTGKHKIPSFPPPQPSKVPAITSPNRESFHPQFESSLPYATVRDFAYPSFHPLHYGASPKDSSPPESQRNSRGLEEEESWFARGNGDRRFSVPTLHTTWGDEAHFRQRQYNQPPPLNFSDGPPWSEDEDLASPVVLHKQHGPTHRKYKSAAHIQHARGPSKNMFSPSTLEHFTDSGNREELDWARRRSAMENGALEPGGAYYATRAGKQDLADGEPGGELYHHSEEDKYDPEGEGYYPDDEAGEGIVYEEDSDYDSRFSKDYRFAVGSPAEEMHGKAVAMFDFIQENENELPLVEGQVVWVSYRHGMGWLVAEDPKTGESGLVPEEYVCLLRDMHAHRHHEDIGDEDEPLPPEAAEGDYYQLGIDELTPQLEGVTFSEDRRMSVPSNGHGYAENPRESREHHERITQPTTTTAPAVDPKERAMHLPMAGRER